MTDPFASLTALAVSTFRERIAAENIEQRWNIVWEWEPALQEAMAASIHLPEGHPNLTAAAVDQFFADSELAMLAPRVGELMPMFLHSRGGFRAPAADIVSGLFEAAFVRIFYERLPLDESTFVQTVLDCFEELRRAARGQPVRVYAVTGIAGVRLSEGKQIS